MKNNYLFEMIFSQGEGGVTRIEDDQRIFWGFGVFQFQISIFLSRKIWQTFLAGLI